MKSWRPLYPVDVIFTTYLYNHWLTQKYSEFWYNGLVWSNIAVLNFSHPIHMILERNVEAGIILILEWKIFNHMNDWNMIDWYLQIFQFFAVLWWFQKQNIFFWLIFQVFAKDRLKNCIERWRQSWRENNKCKKSLFLLFDFFAIFSNDTSDDTTVSDTRVTIGPGFNVPYFHKQKILYTIVHIYHFLLRSIDNKY